MIQLTEDYEENTWNSNWITISPYVEAYHLSRSGAKVEVCMSQAWAQFFLETLGLNPTLVILSSFGLGLGQSIAH